jgi:repressor LexA
MKLHSKQNFISRQQDSKEKLSNPPSAQQDFFARVIEAFSNQSVESIAKQLGLTPPGLYRWRNINALPNGSTLVEIHKKTGVSIHWLLTGQGSKYPDSGNLMVPNPPPSQDFGDQMTVLLEYTMGQKVRELAANEGITPEDQVALFVWESLKDRRMIRTRPDSGEILQYLNLGERQVSWVKVRMRGYIAAGKPIQLLDSDDEQWVEIPDIMVRNRDVYALTAKGDSMIGEGVFDGDVVVVDPHGSIFNGTTVVAIIDGEAATLKKFYKNGSFATLVSANPAYDPIPVHLSKLELKGVMVGVLRGRGRSF